MLSRRSLLAVGGLAALGLSGPAFAAGTPFTTDAFEAALKSGKPILVEVHADWCPVCKAQSPVLEKLTGEARFKDILVFRIDFDEQNDIAKKFGARTQSTLIVFKGGQEVGRSVGDTRADSLAALLGRAV